LEIPPERAINAKIMQRVLTNNEMEICGDKVLAKHLRALPIELRLP
jgi:hypothetical protein